jgi:hypothetical protein
VAPDSFGLAVAFGEEKGDRADEAGEGYEGAALLEVVEVFEGEGALDADETLCIGHAGQRAKDGGLEISEEDGGDADADGEAGDGGEGEGGGAEELASGEAQVLREFFEELARVHEERFRR